MSGNISLSLSALRQSLSGNLVIAGFQLGRLASKALVVSLSLLPALLGLKVQVHAATSSFSTVAGYLDSGPHACTSTLSH